MGRTADSVRRWPTLAGVLVVLTHIDQMLVGNPHRLFERHGGY